MNKMLIDSHIFLWLLQEPDKLGNNALKLIKDSSELFISVASIFELTLKYKKGKLAFNATELLKGVSDLRAELLQIKDLHLISFSENPMNNKDPFDGLLMAQAKSEGLLFMTADKELLASKVDNIINARD